MKIPYFCCIGAELKRYEKDFDFMNQVYLYKVPTDDTIDEVFAQDYFKAISDTVLQDDIVYIYETASQKIHVCRFDKENGHITAVKLASGIPELEPGKILVGDQNGNIASSDLSLEYIKDTLSILHCTVQLSDAVDTTTVVMLDELDAFETLDSRPSYKAAGAIVVDNFGNRGIIESVDQENQTAVIVTIYTAVKSVNGKTGDVVLTGEDISADVSELTDTVQGHLQTLHDNIKDIELFKFPNATIIGEPIIDHGQVSGFSESSYLQFPFIVDLHNQPFIIDICFTTGNDVTTQQNILDSQFGLALAIANGKGLMAISHNGTSWAGSVVGTLAIQPNTTYYARLSWDRINYQTQLSTDGTTFTPDMNFGSTQSPYPRTMFIGGCSGSAIGHTAHPFGGTINMNYAYLTVDGQIVWQGMDDAGLATRMDIDAGNISDAGKERIKQIVDIDSKQNKLIAGANINIDESTNEISATGSGRNIGDTFMTKRTDTELAGAVECDGATYNTTDYTGDGSIGELLEAGKLDYISLSAYSTAIAQTGWCDKIGWDGAGNTAFRVPTINPRHYIIKSQEPTAENNYTWYILYADGRVEQGGQYLWNNTSCPNRVSITYPIPMANAVNSLFITRPKAIGDTGAFDNDGCESQNATGFISAGYSGQNDRSNSFVWQVSGMSSITPQTNTRVMIQIANGATDEALETCTGVLADVAGLKDMSNITATGKETVVGWGMPDYSAGVVKTHNTLYQAETDGIVRLCIGTANNNMQFRYGNDSSVSNVLSVSNGAGVTAITGDFFVPKGTYYQTTGALYVYSTMSNTIMFYPCKK